MADNTTRIAEINAILRSGVRSVTNDGTTVVHDFDSLRKELKKLLSTDDTQRGKRPVAPEMDLSGF